MLKKFLSVSVIVASLASVVHAEQKNGIFAGVSVGLGLVNTKLSNSYSNTSITLGFGVRGGYNYWFGQSFGVRGYLEYDFSGVARFSQTGAVPYGGVGMHDITVNIDALYNFVDTGNTVFGVFLGIGVGYAIPQVTGDSTYTSLISSSSVSYNGFILPINVGVSLGLGDHQRIEIGAKIPTTVARAQRSNVEVLSGRDNLIFVTYQYQF